MADIYDKSPISRFRTGDEASLNSGSQPALRQEPRARWLSGVPSNGGPRGSSVVEPALSRFQFSAQSLPAQTESHSVGIGGGQVLATIALQRNSKAQARVQTQPSLLMRLLASY